MGVASNTPRGSAKEAAKDAPRASDRPGRAGHDDLVGTLISDRYRVTRLLGEGGMGAVYEAEHTLMRKRLAVKVLHAEMSRMPEIVARFEREAMAAGNIDHPNVASASDFGKLSDGSFFLVLEYIEGKSLRDAMAAGPIDAGRTLHIARQVARAIGRAHALQIVHRDLKPENVMLVQRDLDPDFVKVLDFGIAKVPVELLGQTPPPGAPVLTRLGMVFGTPEYMAPEQALGQTVDGRADMYALGVIAFEMLTGSRPFEHDNPAALMAMHVTAKVPLMASVAPQVEVPPAVEALVQRLLAKEASGRFADARELGATIASVLEELAAEGKVDPALVDRAGASGVVSRRGESLPSGASFVSSPTRPATPNAQAHAIASPRRGTPGMAKAADLLAHASAQARAAALRVLAYARALAREKPIIALAAAGAFGAVLLAASLGVVLAGKRPPAGPTGTSRTEGPTLASTALTPKQDGALSAQRSAAEGALARGDVAAAIAALTPLAEAHPGEASLRADLAAAYFASGDEKDALRETQAALAMNPSLASEERLVQGLRRAATSPRSSGEALEILETSMGAQGADVLYDLAYPPHGAATAGAHAALQRASLHASDALTVAMDLRAATSCASKKAVFDRARESGDARALTVLRSLQPTSGCGFLGIRDCWACVHRDGSLEATLAAIEARGGDAAP